MSSVLALIPARGGSKGIPRKNVLPFGGIPLIAYSIEAARRAASVTRVIVSTDNPEIAAVAREWGAEVPFLRPAEFAQDHTTDLPVFLHALGWLRDHEHVVPELVVQLRPTSPLRPHDCIDRGVALLRASPAADSLRAVIPSQENPYKTWRIDPATGQLRPLLTVDGVAEPYNAPRQLLPQTYWQTGHLDVIRTATLLDQHSMSGAVLMPLVLGPEFAVDLDTMEDWARAEQRLQRLVGRVVIPHAGQGGIQ